MDLGSAVENNVCMLAIGKFNDGVGPSWASQQGFAALITRVGAGHYTVTTEQNGAVFCDASLFGAGLNPAKANTIWYVIVDDHTVDIFTSDGAALADLGGGVQIKVWRSIN